MVKFGYSFAELKSTYDPGLWEFNKGATLCALCPVSGLGPIEFLSRSAVLGLKRSAVPGLSRSAVPGLNSPPLPGRLPEGPTLGGGTSNGPAGESIGITGALEGGAQLGIR